MRFSICFVTEQDFRDNHNGSNDYYNNVLAMHCAVFTSLFDNHFVSHNSTGILYRADHQPMIKKNKKKPLLSPPHQGWQKTEEKKE